MKLLPFVVVAALPLLSGCKKSACEMNHPGPLTFPWQGKEDLFPPGAKVCGSDGSTLRMSFPKDENPFVTIVQHLESKGWSRARQDVKNLDYLTSTLVGTDGSEIQLTVSRQSGYEIEGSMAMSHPDCTSSHAKDDTACTKNNRQIVKCKGQNKVGDGATCDRPSFCATQSMKHEKLETAACVTN